MFRLPDLLTAENIMCHKMKLLQTWQPLSERCFDKRSIPAPNIPNTSKSHSRSSSFPVAIAFSHIKGISKWTTPIKGNSGTKSLPARSPLDWLSIKANIIAPNQAPRPFVATYENSTAGHENKGSIWQEVVYRFNKLAHWDWAASKTDPKPLFFQVAFQLSFRFFLYPVAAQALLQILSLSAEFQ